LADYNNVNVEMKGSIIRDSRLFTYYVTNACLFTYTKRCVLATIPLSHLSIKKH